MYKIQDLARRNLKAINAKTAAHAGTGACLMSHTPNIKTTLKKLIKKISKEDIINETVPHNDIEEAQASSIKPEDLHAANTKSFKRQASRTISHKPQAPSTKV